MHRYRRQDSLLFLHTLQLRSTCFCIYSSPTLQRLPALCHSQSFLTGKLTVSKRSTAFFHIPLLKNMSGCPDGALHFHRPPESCLPRNLIYPISSAQFRKLMGHIVGNMNFRVVLCVVHILDDCDAAIR